MKKALLSLLCILTLSFAANADKYALVTSADDLEIGAKYIIVCPTKQMGMGAQNGTYFSNISIASIYTQNAKEIDFDATKYALNVLELGKTESGYTFKIGDTYLQSTAAKSMNTSTTLGDNCYWTINITSSETTITSTKISGNKIQYNFSSPRFCAYTSAQTAIVLFKEVKEQEPPSGGEVIDIDEDKIVVKANGDEVSDVAVVAPGSIITWEYPTDIKDAQLSYRYEAEFGEYAADGNTNSYTFTGENATEILYLYVASGDNEEMAMLQVYREKPEIIPAAKFNVENGATVVVGQKITADANGADFVSLYVGEDQIDSENMKSPTYVVEGEIGNQITLTAMAGVMFFDETADGGLGMDFAEPVSVTVTIVEQTEETIDLAQQGYENAQVVSEVEGNKVKLTFAKGNNTNGNVPTYYNSGTAVRVYQGNTLTIEIPDNYYITKVTFDVSSSWNNPSCSSGAFATATTTGSVWNADEATYVNTLTLTGATRYQTIKVEWKPFPLVELSTEKLVVKNGEEIAEYDVEKDAYVIKAESGTAITWSYDSTEKSTITYSFAPNDNPDEVTEGNSVIFEGVKLDFIAKATSANTVGVHVIVTKYYPTECPAPMFNVEDGGNVYEDDVITVDANGADSVSLSVNGEPVNGHSWTVAGKVGDEITLKAEASIEVEDGKILKTEVTVKVTIADLPDGFFDFNKENAYGIVTSSSDFDGGEKVLGTVGKVTASVTGTYRIVTLGNGHGLRLHATQNGNGIGELTVTVPDNYEIYEIDFGTGSTSSLAKFSSGECKNNKWAPSEDDAPVSFVTISKDSGNPAFANMTVKYREKLPVINHESGSFENTTGDATATFTVKDVEGTHEFSGSVDINAHAAFSKPGAIHEVTVTANGKAYTFYVLTAPKLGEPVLDKENKIITYKPEHDSDNVKLQYRAYVQNDPTAQMKSRAGEGDWNDADENGEIVLNEGDSKVEIRAVSRNDESLVSKAQVSNTYTEIETGVAEVVVAEGEAVVYDLNGRVVSGELTPGVYIVRKGNKALKVVIK